MPNDQTTCRRTRKWPPIGFFALPVILAIVIVARGSPEARAFKRHVCRPIPDSVDEIRADLRSSRPGRRYVGRFQIDAADVAAIAQSRPFDEFESVSFDGSSLQWQGPKNPLHGTSLLGDSESIAPYWTRTPPQWFRRDEWTHPKVYRLREKWGKSSRSHVQVLIHNDQTNGAYFIDYVEGW